MLARLLNRLPLPRSHLELSPRLRLQNKLWYWKERLLGAPLPPTTMMFLVQGNPEAAYYVAGGKKAWETIIETLEKSYVPPRQFETILDFGCGCGRVLRHWRGARKGLSLHGTDYNPELVYWCRRLVPFAQIGQNGLEPPLHYSDNMFDFIYTFSTFTHWHLALQCAWMREFQRVLRPGGYLLFTTHGDYYVPRLPPEYQELFRNGEAIGPDLGSAVAGTNHYASFNPFGQVRDQLLQGLELVEFYRRGSRGTPWQDVYLVRKPSLVAVGG